jgi:hypothetical protein
MRQLLMLSMMVLFLLVVAGWRQQASAGFTVDASVDHYKCYKVKGKALDPPPTPGVVDEFESDTDTVGKPFMICNPASKNGSNVFFPSTHQLCYKIKGTKKIPKLTVRVTNQFVPSGQDLKVSTKEKLLCVPGGKSCLDANGQPIACPNEP